MDNKPFLKDAEGNEINPAVAIMNDDTGEVIYSMNAWTYNDPRACDYERHAEKMGAKNFTVFYYGVPVCGRVGNIKVKGE